MKRQENVDPKAPESIQLNLAGLTNRLKLSSFNEATKSDLAMAIAIDQFVFLSLNELALRGLSEQLDESLQAIEETFIAIHNSGSYPPGEVMEMTVQNKELHKRLGIIQENAEKLIPTPTGEPMSTATTSTSTTTRSTTAAVISTMEKPSAQFNEDDGDYAVAMALIEEDDADHVAPPPRPPLKGLATTSAATTSRTTAAGDSLNNNSVRSANNDAPRPVADLNAPRPAPFASQSINSNNDALRPAANLNAPRPAPFASQSINSDNDALRPAANLNAPPPRFLPPAAIPRPEEHQTPGGPVPQAKKAISSTCREVLELFEKTYTNERKEPNGYENNYRLAAPEAKHIIRLTQKNYAFYLLEELENLNPSPNFYIVGKHANENSVFHIPGNPDGFSRIEGVFIQSGDTTLYMTLGGVSAPRYRVTGATAPRNLAQDAPNFGELCQSGVLDLTGCKTLSFVPSDFGLATKRESTMTDGLIATLTGLIESAGEKTTAHMAPITARLARDKERALEEQERRRIALARKPEDQELKAAFLEAQDRSVRANNAQNSVNESIHRSVTSATNSISATPRNPTDYPAPRRPGMPLPPQATAAPGAAHVQRGIPRPPGMPQAQAPAAPGAAIGGGGLPRRAPAAPIRLFGPENALQEEKSALNALGPKPL